jgi:hypothetical protein
MADSYVATRNFSYDLKEKKQDELKDWSHEFDKIVTSNINNVVD